MPKIPTFEARGSIEQLSGTTSNIQLGLNNNLASALAPVTKAVVNHAVKENALQNQAEALRLENKFIVEMNEVQNTINTDERFATNKILANEYLNEKSDSLIKKYRSLATNGNVQDKFSTYGLAETQKAIFRTDSQISKNILLDLNNGYLEAKQNYLNTALTNGEFDAATLTTDLLNLTNNTWKDQISPPLLEKMLNGIPNEIDMYGAVKLIQDDPKTALMQLKDDNFFINLDVDERLTLQGEAKKILAPRIDADWKDVLAGATKGKKIEFDMEFAKEILPPDVIDKMVKEKKIIDVTVDNIALINSMPNSELESSLEIFTAEGIALAGEAEGQKIQTKYKNAIVARTAALNKDPVNFLIENNDEIKQGYEDVANTTDGLARSQAKNNLVNLIVQTQKDMGVPNEKIKVMSSSEASSFVANYMKNATGNPANASSLLNSVITNFGENDGQALLELQAAGLPFNAVLSQQGFLTENEKRKAFSFDTAEEKTKLLDFAKRKNEDFDFKDLKIEISNMEGFEELENIVRLNNQFESTDGVGQMDNVVEFLSYYALNEMYTNSKYDQDDAAESAVNMFVKNFDTTQDTFYVPNKYEGKDLTEFGQTTDGVINKTKLIQEHYLSDFNAVAYKSSTGDVDEKELTDKMILNMKVNGEWRNTANGDSLIYGIVLADTSFAPVLNADGNELSFKINDTSDILPGGSNIALDPSKLRIANKGNVYSMNKMIEVPSEDLFTSIPDKKQNNMNLGFGLNINDTAQESGYDQYKSSLFESLGAVAADNWNFNPGSSLVLWSQKIDAQIQSTKQNLEKVNRQNLNKEYAKIGLYFDEDEYQSVVDIMVKEKKEERARQSIMERGPEGSWNPLNKGFYVGAAKLTTGLAVSMVDPINIAASFIPVFGQARFAKLVAKQGFTKARAVRGAVEGIAGAAIVEPLVYGVAQSVQADYDLYDSFLNIGFGAVMGSGLHVGAGKLKDANTRRKWNNRITEGKKILGDDSETKVDINFYREYYPETSEIMRDLEASDPRTRLALLQKAVGDQILDNPTDVTHVANGDPVLRDSPDAKPNPDVNARPKTSLDEMELNNLEQTVVNKNIAEDIADNDILESQLNDLKNKQKDLDLSFSNDDAAVKVASDEFNEVNARSKDLDAIIKDAINCVNGR